MSDLEKILKEDLICAGEAHNSMTHVKFQVDRACDQCGKLHKEFWILNDEFVCQNCLGKVHYVNKHFLKEPSKLDTLIKQDVEHGTFSSRNIYNEEYLTPQFYEYAKMVEKDVDILAKRVCELQSDCATLRDKNTVLRKKNFDLKEKVLAAKNPEYIDKIAAALQGEVELTSVELKECLEFLYSL